MARPAYHAGMRHPRVLFAVLALLAALGAAACGEDRDAAAARTTPERLTAEVTRDRALVGDLRAGGVILLMRHATSDNATDRVEKVGDCSTQRNLTRVGRRQAEKLGDDVRALGVPVGEVRASPLCRAFDTAELAFGRPEADAILIALGTAGGQKTSDRRVRALRRKLATAPPAGTDTVLVTHTPNIGEATELSLDEGETAIFRPAAGGRFELLGRVPADAWPRLARSAGPPPG